MLFLVNLRPFPKIQAWGGVVNAIYSKFTTPPQNQSLGRGRKYLIWYNYPCHVSPITCTSNLRPFPTSTVLYYSFKLKFFDQDDRDVRLWCQNGSGDVIRQFSLKKFPNPLRLDKLLTHETVLNSFCKEL